MARGVGVEEGTQGGEGDAVGIGKGVCGCAVSSVSGFMGVPAEQGRRVHRLG
jgi:hypothetical protein